MKNTMVGPLPLPDFEESPGGLSPALTTIFAVAGGLCVANVYAAQPLLDAMGASFGMEAAALGSVITVTQIGYALGLVLAVPLGDIVDRRRLIIGHMALSIVALIAAATAQSTVALLASLFTVGFLAVVVQTLVAYAASLAVPGQRGAAVGKITGGIVIGILGARFAAGTLTDLAGWRAVYLVSAAALSGMALVLWRALPRDVRPRSDGYLAVLGSLPRLFLNDRALLLRGLFALAIFAAFSTFWTALVLPLRAPPYALSHGEIGLFGLVGIAGALAARRAGRLADKGMAKAVTGIALALLCASWAFIALLPMSLVGLIVGVVGLDLAVQAVHVTSQTVIVGRHPGAQGRIIAGYMVFYSIGSALGAFGATRAYAAAGWAGVCILGTGFSVLGLASWVGTTSWRARAGRLESRPRLGPDLL
ncbi:MFS transporter [Beijerinckia sp. L45]|uniref:MFS transporter n=1 Tax=Beijerinckia sp. L45 TaxID=1641855 RepID=UPI00157731AF|nr:MFS transporter [Beijerinckia sp. L45]